MDQIIEMDLTPGVTFGIHIQRLDPQQVPLCTFNAELQLPSASAGKLMLLIALAQAISAGDIDPEERLYRYAQPAVEDAGLWWHLEQESFTVPDLAKLVGTVSDNLATNVLLRHLGGPAAVMARAQLYSIRDVYLHDYVRAHRTAQHPATLSSGSARAYSELFALLWRRAQHDDPVATQVLAWLADSVDVGLVPAFAELDPLAHHGSQDAVRVYNKTGSDAGVRVDTGLIIMPQAVYTYACLANWAPTQLPDPRATVFRTLRSIGQLLQAESAKLVEPHGKEER